LEVKIFKNRKDKTMSVVKQMFAVLVTVGVVSSLALAATYTLTQPRIEQNKREELQESIFVVLPDAKDCERNENNECKNIGTEEFEVYKGLNENKEPVGYAFVAEGSGFQGTIEMIVGIDSDLDTLFGMKVLEQGETPGLGAKIAEETPKKDFSEQFVKLAIPASEKAAEIADFILCVKGVEDPNVPNDVQAITGATISSNAVVSIINQSLVKLLEVVKKDKG
jgi:electron transport complex protein RnfG